MERNRKADRSLAAINLNWVQTMLPKDCEYNSEFLKTKLPFLTTELTKIMFTTGHAK